ncbi:MAG TPA: hypothetical protein VFC56_11515 [Stellaceae bacterium]|nr:hypothetical protein [Stellaceae bacterium]
MVAALSGLLAGCAPLLGYPKDPEDTDATLTRLAPYFNGDEEAQYLALAVPTLRAQKRNDIILARIHAYDIEFADFERRLYGDGNATTLGGDLVGLVLAGLTATTGNAATKSALGAASAGVIGASSAINKDLYYQKTIPALLAQMEADRLKAELPITTGLKLSDAGYPLAQAYIDLDAYKTAGSIPAAINAVNQSAGNAKDAAQAALRSTAFVEDTFSQRLRSFIWPSGMTNPPNQMNLTKLRQWMSAHLPADVPVQTLLNGATLADQRKQAVSDLSVP